MFGWRIRVMRREKYLRILGQYLGILTLVAVVAMLLGGCERHSRLRLVDGGEVDWSSYRGKWVVINYWAEWCVPCRKEMPELNGFAESHADQVVVLGVNYDGLPAAELLQAADKMLANFPQLLQDPAAILPHQRPVVLPTTVIYDPQGNLKAELVGPQTEASLRLWLRGE